jgi:hypothetical protein
MKIYILGIITAALVLFLHLLGIENALYFYYPWYDLILHFLGGAALAFFILIFTKSWKKAIIGMLILATGWEIFEYVLNIAGENYIVDTVIDFIMDLVGASIAIFISKK